MDPEAVHALYRALRQVLISAVSLLLIFDVLRQPPLELVGLPRIAYTLFCVSVAIAIFRLLRPSSAFVTGALARPGSDRMRRVWPAINGIVTLIMLAVIVLDVAGYRYGSKQLAISVLQTLVLILLASPLHYWLISAVTTLTGRRKPAALAEAPGSEQPGELEVRDTAERLVGFVRVLSLIAVVLVLSRIWGVDQQALESLGETQLYEVGEDQHVSALNVLQLLAFVAGTIWLLRVLPGIFEFLIFSRITLDSGLRYAILTISQYALFTIGFLLALSAIRLDLSRLGWLLAAMGVGLGFGLQEIVSNFVSGIILLVERPIRVGDIVTITQVSGTVKRINIRATTLLNFDRQEVIIPNRKLITGDVTNWTGSDSINRLVIPIGVAYGSNVDRVSEILTGVIRGQPEVLVDPAPTVLFVAHGESSLNFELRVFVPDPSHKMPLLDRLNKAINKALAAERIEIPFPQRDVHIRSEQVTSDGRGPNGE